MSAKKTSISVRVAASAIDTTFGGTTNQAIFHLNPKAFDAFSVELKSEPKTVEGLRKLLDKCAPWDHQNSKEIGL